MSAGIVLLIEDAMRRVTARPTFWSTAIRELRCENQGHRFRHLCWNLWPTFGDLLFDLGSQNHRFRLWNWCLRVQNGGHDATLAPQGVCWGPEAMLSKSSTRRWPQKRDHFGAFWWFLESFLESVLMIVRSDDFCMKIFDFLRIDVLPKREHHFWRSGVDLEGLGDSQNRSKVVSERVKIER